MPKKRLSECPVCKGQNKKCKYLINGRKCSYGLAKGKAISKETIEKREKYDIQIGNLHTDYLNDMRNRQISAHVEPETGEIIGYIEIGAKYVSFERWLNMNEHKNVAKHLRTHYKKLKTFNFDDFNKEENKEMNAQEAEEMEVLSEKSPISTFLKICSKNNQKFMDDYIKKIDDMILDYSKRGMNISKYKDQSYTLKKFKTVENINKFYKLSLSERTQFFMSL